MLALRADGVTTARGSAERLLQVASLLALRTRALPRWLGWAGMAASVLLLASWIYVPLYLFRAVDGRGWTRARSSCASSSAAARARLGHAGLS